jgi:hypothetical protein
VGELAAYGGPCGKQRWDVDARRRGRSGAAEFARTSS